MPLKCHMQKLLDIHQWLKYVNIYVTYDLTGIKHMTLYTDDNDDARCCRAVMMM